MEELSERLDLNVDLIEGMVPISKAASALAALLRQARQSQRPIVITQKGYPSGIILPIDLYNLLLARVQASTRGGPSPVAAGEGQAASRPSAGEGPAG